MVKFIFLSFIFHLTLLVIFKLEIVDLRKNKEKTISVNLSQENQTLNKKEKPKKEVKAKKSVKKEKPKKEVKAKKSVKKEKPKKEVKAKKSVKKEKPKKEIKTKKSVKKEKPKKEIKTKKSVKKEKPKKEDFDDLLKNLAKKELSQEITENFDKKIQKLSEQTLIDKKLTNENKLNKNELIDIEELLMKQIDEKWSRPPGIAVSKGLEIKMIVNLDINGKVIDLQVHKKTQNDIKNNSTLQPYLESAIRAIKKASPFEGLRKDRYSVWRNLIINFIPIEAR